MDGGPCYGLGMRGTATLILAAATLTFAGCKDNRQADLL